METLLEKLSPLIPESLTTRAILIGAVVALVLYQLTKKRYRYPPGPRGLPLLGNVLSIRTVPVYRKLMEWEKTYGPVMSVMMGPMRTVFLNTSEAVQEAFVKKSADFAGRPHMYSMHVFTDGGKDIAFTDYGPTWQLHRRLALKALSQYMKGTRFQETIEDVLKMVVQEIRKEEGSFDIRRYLEFTIFNILSKICFDEKFPLDDEEFRGFCEMQERGNREFGNGFWEDVIPPLRRWPTRKFRSFLENIKIMNDFIYTRVSRHRTDFDPDIQRDFTDAILIAQKEAEKDENPEVLSQFTDTHVAQTVTDVFQAGLDTSRQTLYWTVLFVAAHPEVQEKIHEEVDRVMGDSRSPLISDRHKLAYTEAVLCESMRCAPAAPLSLPHTTTCDTTIGDYDLPKGTVVMSNIWGIQNDPKLWEKPNEFRPERFLQGQRSQRPEGWMPFSVGKRACMAKSLAEPELHLLLAGLYRNFEFHLPEGETADLNPDENAPMGYMTKPYKVVAKYRLS